MPRRKAIDPHAYDARQQAALKFAQQMGVNMVATPLGQELDLADLAQKISAFMSNKYGSGALFLSIVLTSEGIGIGGNLQSLAPRDLEAALIRVRRELDRLEREAFARGRK